MSTVMAASISNVELNPTITPSVTATAVSVPTTPVISGFTPAGCVKTTDQILVSGSRFGSQAGKGVAVSGNGIHEDLQIIKWNDTAIALQLPAKSRLVSGQSYSITVETLNHTALSNSLNGLHLCTLASASTSTTVNTLTAVNTIPTPAPAVTSASNPALSMLNNTTEVANEFSGAPVASATLTNNTGSLVDRQLPPPPTVPNVQVQQDDDDANEPGEILVINTGVKQAETLRKQVGTLGMRVLRRTRLINLGLVLSVVQIPKNRPQGEALKELRQQFPKLWLDTNARYRLQGSTDNSLRYHYARQLISWPEKLTCAHKAKIGLVDSGIDQQNPSLKGQQIIQKQFLPQGVVPAAAAHGTAIAALLIGWPVSTRLSGLLPDAQLRVASVFRQRDDNNIDTTAELLVRAVDWLVGEQVSVINLSLGGARNLLIEAALSQAMKQHITIVAAAGNGGEYAPPSYPAAQPGVIAVTALDAEMNIFSNASRGNYITLAAPGVDVWSAASGAKGRFYSGTSYAVPFVTAFMALQSRMDESTLQKFLQQHTRDLGSPGRDPIFGWGLLQAQDVCGLHAQAKSK